MADGEIVINSKLDNREFMSNTKQLMSAVKSLQSTTAKIGKDMASSASGYGAAMRKNISASREVQAEMDRLSAKAREMRRELEARGSQSGAKQYIDLRNQIKQTEKALDAAIGKVDRLKETKGINSTAFRNANDEANRLAAKLDALQDKMNTMSRPSDQAILSYQQQRQAIRDVESELSELQRQQADVGGARTVFIGLAKSAGHAVASLAKLAGTGALSFLKKLAAGAKNAAIQLAKLAANAVKTGVSKLGGMLGGAARSMLGFNRSQKSAGAGLKVGLKNVLRYAFGIRSLFVLFRRLRAAISEGFGELKKTNPEVKASLDGLQRALNGLKVSLASAFAPILTAVAPALTTLINMLASAINTIGAFFAALTGKSTYARAVGGLSNVGKAAGGASKKAKELKRELAGFDELNILKSKDSGGGGGGGGGGAGFSYESVPIDSAITDFVDKLKKLWSEGKYEEVGAAIAEGINNAFEHAKTLIEWNTVKDTVTEAIDAIAGVFNGFVTGVHWWLIGATVGAAFNTIIQSANRILTDVDWTAIGDAIGNFFIGLEDQVNADDLGDLFVNVFKAALRRLLGFLATGFVGRTGHWLGRALNRIFTNKELFTTAGEAFNKLASEALSFGSNFLTEFRKNLPMIVDNIKAALGEIDWAGIANEAWELFKEALLLVADFISALFSDGDVEVKPNIRRQRQNERLGQYTDTGTGTPAKPDTSASGMAGAVTSALTGALSGLKGLIESVNWKQIGTDIGEFVTSVDWGKLATAIFDVLYELLSGIFTAISGLDDVLSRKVFGDNYQENEAWQALHPLKYAEYVQEMRKKWEDENPDLAARQNELIDETKEVFLDTFQNLMSGDVLDYTLNDLLNAGSLVSQEHPDEKQLDRAEEALSALQTGLPSEAEWSQAEQAWETVETLDTSGIFAEDAADTIAEKTADAVAESIDTGLPNEADRPVKPFGQWIDDKIFNFAAVFSLGLKAEEDEYDNIGEALRSAEIAQRKQTKAEKAQTKALGNGLDLNVEGNSLGKITGDGETTVTATVNFVPPKGDDEDSPTGLLDWLSALFEAGVSVEALVSLIKNGWTTVEAFVNASMGSKIAQGVSLVKEGFRTVQEKIQSVGWWSPNKNQSSAGSLGMAVSLVKEGFTNVRSKIASAGWWSSNGDKSSSSPLGMGIKLVKEGFTNVKTKVASAGWWSSSSKRSQTSPLGMAISLVKKGFETVSQKVQTTGRNGWWGGVVNKAISLIKGENNRGWSTVGAWVSGFLGSAVDVVVNLVSGGIPGWLKSIFHILGIPGFSNGGYIYPNGNSGSFANGGMIRKSASTMFGGINRYAGGTSNAHGSLFLAGEAGPEVVGHVGGRTEVLNKSQIAQAIYSAVVAGSAQAVNALGKYLASHMTVCTNAIVTTIGSNLGISGRIDYYAPAMINGGIVPYDVSAQIARSTQEIQTTLDQNNDELIQAMVNAIANAAANIVNAVQRGQRNGTNYTTQNAIDDINRRAMMFNRSPLNV